MGHPCKESQTVCENKELLIPCCDHGRGYSSYLQLLKMNENLELLKYDTSPKIETPPTSKHDTLKSTESTVASKDDKWSTIVAVDSSELFQAPSPPPQPRPRPPLTPILNYMLPTLHPTADLDALPDTSLHPQILDEELDACLDLRSCDSSEQIQHDLPNSDRGKETQ